jgi:hypothetical protein
MACSSNAPSFHVANLPRQCAAVLRHARANNLHRYIGGDTLHLLHGYALVRNNAQSDRLALTTTARLCVVDHCLIRVQDRGEPAAPINAADARA